MKPRAIAHGGKGERQSALLERLAWVNDNKTASFAGLWQFGVAILLFPVLTFVLATLWLMAGGVLTQIVAMTIMSGSAMAAIFAGISLFREAGGIPACASVAFGSCAMLIAALVADTSIDGQHYHFQAIYAFANGWNPYWDTMAPPTIGDPITLWAIHYPRAGWIISATWLAAGLPLGAVKATNLMAVFATAAFVAGALVRLKYSSGIALLMAVAAAANPILLSQAFTSMNDGLLGVCMIVFLVSAAVTIQFGDQRALLPAVAALILGLNIKFSSLPLFAILAGFMCVATLWALGLRASVVLGSILLVTAFFAVAILGWSPYVQNAMTFGHVFYPLMGPQAVDIMVGNTPQVLEAQSTLQRFLYSHFAETHAGYETRAALKWPFSVSRAELRAAGGVDVRIGGFGPLFSGVLVVTLAGIATLFPSLRKQPNPTVIALLFMAGVLLISVLAMPQNWWARYVPQLWFVPLCVAGALVAVRSKRQFLGLTILGLMLIDSTLVGGASVWRAIERSRQLDAQIADMSKSGRSYCVDPEMVQSRLYLMREAGIDARYTPGAAVSCAAPTEIAGYGPDRFGGAICECR